MYIQRFQLDYYMYLSAVQTFLDTNLKIVNVVFNNAVTAWSRAGFTYKEGARFARSLLVFYNVTI